MNFKNITFLGIAVAALSFACSNRGETEYQKQQEELREKLSEVPLSQELGYNVGLSQTCDLSKASTALKEDLNLSVSEASRIWDRCQQSYVCSSTTESLIRNMFESGARFRLGFTDLKALNLSNTGDRVRGLFLSGTDQIYLDESIKNNLEACSLIVHELVHRFDPEAQRGEESLKTEFRAYYYQVAFTGEFSILENKDKPTTDLYTRETLLKKVAEMQGFELDLAIIQPYRPFKWEKN